MALSPKEVPAEYANKNSKCLGDDGKRKKAGAEALLPLFPLPIVPYSLWYEEASVEERFSVAIIIIVSR